MVHVSDADLLVMTGENAGLAGGFEPRLYPWDVRRVLVEHGCPPAAEFHRVRPRLVGPEPPMLGWGWARSLFRSWCHEHDFHDAGIGIIAVRPKPIEQGSSEPGPWKEVGEEEV